MIRMPPFINSSNITMDNITAITNSTNLIDISIKSSWLIYDGYLYFLLFLTAFILIYIKAQSIEDQPLKNAMDSATIISIAVIFFRGIEILISGSFKPMLTDHHLWLFPLIAVCLALINYMTKK